MSASPTFTGMLVMPWQPIDTAPKDGTRILGWIGKAEVVQWHSFTQGGGCWGYSDDGWLCEPSRWMPLPEPPK